MRSRDQSRVVVLAALLGATMAASSTGATTTTSSQSITGLGASSSASTTAASDLFEIDVIFPRANVTYNYTETLPIIFDLQGLLKATAVGDFDFGWGIMPYGNVGQEQQPGGVWADNKESRFTAANITSDTYIYINVTNTRLWDFPPHNPQGSVYSLQWYLSWVELYGKCDNQTQIQGNIFFNINAGDPEPDLLNLPTCPALGAVVDLNATALKPSVTTCVTVATPASGRGDPCAITIDAAVASSMSSVVHSLATPPASTTSTSSSMNAAVATAIPLRSLGAAALVLGSNLLYQL